MTHIKMPRENANGLAQAHDHRPRPTIQEQFRGAWVIAIIGCVLCTVGMCLLFWNEGRAASIARSLDEARESIAVIEDPRKIPEDYENRLVYISGPLWIAEPLTEPEYGVIIDSVKLKRRVQVYQWVEFEEERTYAGEVQADKNYWYTTEWRDKLIDSDQFYIRTGHENPKQVVIKSQVQMADEVKIGAITLGMELKKTFTDFMEITSDQRPDRTDIKMHAGLYYHSQDLWNPQVGDIRILLSYAGKAGDTYSVVGKLEKGTIVPFVTSHGEQILLQRRHKFTVDRMFHLEHVNNYWRTWILRVLGWLILFLATTCLSNILKTIIQRSTYLCGIITSDSISMSVSMTISLLVIGLAWMWYRPLVAFVLAAASMTPFLYSKFFSTNHHNRYRRL